MGEELDDKLRQLGPKDLLLFVTTVGTMLAISWEIGSFVPVGASIFGIFSLAEHLTFALQALPLAFATSLSGVVLALYLARSRLRRRAIRGERVHRIVVGTVALLMPAFVFGAGFSTFRYFGYPFAPYYMLSALALGGSLVMASSLFQFDTSRSRLFGSLALMSYLLVLAFCVGIEQTRLKKEMGLPITIETDNGTRDLIVLRVNTTALIGFDRPARRIVSIKGDRVKGMAWNSDW